MARKFTLIAGLAALFAVGSAPAEAACPTITEVISDVVNPETGHTFSKFEAPEITWDEAQECVTDLNQSLPLGDVRAHLATITSSSENQWIVDTLLLAEPLLTKTQVWVGGFQEDPVPSPGEPDEGWRWVNFEGPIPVPDSTVTLGYSNWHPSEPNNSSVNEKHLTLGRYATNATTLGLWNDEGAEIGSIGGFLIEYDTPRTEDAGCTPTGGTTACTTVNGQTLTFPPGTFDEDSSFTFTAYEFTDPRNVSGRCNGQETLTLFTDDAFGPGGSGALEIPKYLCGSPRFLVIRAQGDITIPKGVVVTKSVTETILPDNDFACDVSVLAAGSSPQQQDVGVWQSLNRTEMWENSPTVPVARFAGAATELTTACASTLIKTRSKSNFVVGLHIDFGLIYNSTAEYSEMVELTKYKTSLVRQSVVEARRVGSISNANGQAMLSQLDSVASSLNANNPVGARKKIQDFLKKVNSSTYSLLLQTPFNFHGDHLSRGENILFTLNHKVIPFKPVP